MVIRTLQNIIKERLNKGKAIIIFGARQVGKTTLLKQLFSNTQNVMWLNGDEDDVRTIFENSSSTRLKAIFGQNKTIIIDEAQRISDIGLKLKLITDNIPDIQLVATGSSSFVLANKINEPLTGRKFEYKMFPFSFAEMVNNTNLIEEKRMLPHRLVFGYYPDIVMNPGDEQTLLTQLSNSYLYKDIFEIENIRRADKIEKLLKALAYQIGSEVSLNELSQLCGIDVKTVDKYISLLEQAYIIFRLGSYSRNLRNELKSKQKIYFYDNGIRNAIIGDYSLIENRQDAGHLFENFVISECIKTNAYKTNNIASYFWRTTTRQEIDYIEVTGNDITAVEIKWNSKRKASLPNSFSTAYPNADFKVINRDNIEDFLIFRDNEL
ncbi:MAG: ATP-binding protein [Bacteroidales bacterium]|nr:ATP-binding protein [Bacteroidales bacterium]